MYFWYGVSDGFWWHPRANGAVSGYLFSRCVGPVFTLLSTLKFVPGDCIGPICMFTIMLDVTYSLPTQNLYQLSKFINLIKYKTQSYLFLKVFISRKAVYKYPNFKKAHHWWNYQIYVDKVSKFQSSVYQIHYSLQVCQQEKINILWKFVSPIDPPLLLLV